VCAQSSEVKLARAALHFWEEPPISGTGGSGAIFFSGCNLGCVYCQNAEISARGFGRPVTQERLVAIMFELAAAGAHNLNLVTPTHFAPSIVAALREARAQGLTLPVVYNTSGYERVEAVQALASWVDVWLCDVKYARPATAALSHARDYVAVARAAARAMAAAVEAAGGRLVEDGLMKRGLIVRHLVLPGHAQESCEVLDALYEELGPAVDVSIMNQYTPNAAARERGDALSRTVSEAEYNRVLDYACDLGFEHLWWQEGGTQTESFIPPFDLTGVEAAAGATGAAAPATAAASGAPAAASGAPGTAPAEKNHR
jgi:putative pyruvate formate lyase activating enzyme